MPKQEKIIRLKEQIEEVKQENQKNHQMIAKLRVSRTRPKVPPEKTHVRIKSDHNFDLKRLQSTDVKLFIAKKFSDQKRMPTSMQQISRRLNFNSTGQKSDRNKPFVSPKKKIVLPDPSIPIHLDSVSALANMGDYFASASEDSLIKVWKYKNSSLELANTLRGNFISIV